MKIKLALVFDRKVLLLGLLALVLVLIPTDVVHAGLATTIGNAIANSVLFVTEKSLTILTGILGLFYNIIAIALVEVSRWILGIGVRPGAPTTPIFVTNAFNIVLQLVNIFFILILVFIGLATILRFQTYELKKTLPWLLAMALLVNFSGVFVGFIVDISNLVTIWFLDKAVGDWNTFSGITEVPILNEGYSASGKIANSIASIIYYLVAILIYLVVLILFVVRTMFLWALVIVAPLAFASYVLPATRGKIWNEWWSQLIQWSIFVIPLSFFMWLASGALKFNFSTVRGEVPLGTEANFFANFLSPFTALLLLYIGLMTSQRMAPAAAQGIIKLSKKAAGFAAFKGGMVLGRKYVPKIKKLGEKMRERGSEAKGTPEGAGMLRKGLSATMNQPFARWGIRQAGTGIEFAGANAQIRINKYNRKEAEEAKKSVEGMNPDDKERMYQNARGNSLRQAAIMSTMKGDDVTKALEDKRISEQDFRRSYKIAESQGPPAKRAFINSFSNLIDKTGLTDKEQKEALKDAHENVKGAADIDKFDSEALNPNTKAGRRVIDSLGRHLTPQLATQLLLRKTEEKEGIMRAWKENIEKGAGGEGANMNDKLRWADENNYLSKVRWSTSTAATAAGIEPLIVGVEPDDIKAFIKDKNISNETLTKRNSELSKRKENLETQLASAELELPGKPALSDKEREDLNEELNEINQGLKEVERIQQGRQNIEDRLDNLKTELVNLTMRGIPDPHRDELVEEIQRLENEIDRRQRGRQRNSQTTEKEEAKQAELQESSDPIGRVYQQWTKQIQRTQELGASLSDLEGQVVKLPNKRGRDQAFRMLQQLETVASAEEKIAQEIRSQVIELSKEFGGLSIKEQTKAIKPLGLNTKRSSTIDRAKKTLEKLQANLQKAENKQREEEQTPPAPPTATPPGGRRRGSPPSRGGPPPSSPRGRNPMGPRQSGTERKVVNIVNVNDKEFEKRLKEGLVTFEDTEKLSDAAGRTKDIRTASRLYDRVDAITNILIQKNKAKDEKRKSGENT